MAAAGAVLLLAARGAHVGLLAIAGAVSLLNATCISCYLPHHLHQVRTAVRTGHAAPQAHRAITAMFTLTVLTALLAAVALAAER
ncbi:hypothetical protein ACL03H_01140 [Saccharopolyspora sp. MS10]